MAERRPVTREDYEAEVAELRRLRAEYENKWTSLRRIVASIRRWERIIADLEARFAELRRIGWARLRMPERREYLNIRDVRLGRARAFWLGWDTERTSIITEIKHEREEIRSLEAEIARKIVIVEYFLTITVNNPEWGTTRPAPATYRYRAGTTATVTAIPAEGYTLDYWQLNDTKVEPHPGDTINILMDKNHTLTAVFTPIVKQLVHAKIIIYSTVQGKPPKPYTKRFQAIWNVDAIRDPATGEIDYSAKLTEKEIDVCMDYFYALWNWTSLPPRASEPVWIESGQWEEIAEPQGADLKEASVRKNEEETYRRRYIPPEVVYVPSKSESEEMMKLVKGEEK